VQQRQPPTGAFRTTPIVEAAWPAHIPRTGESLSG
jgi:hypothetical protein